MFLGNSRELGRRSRQRAWGSRPRLATLPCAPAQLACLRKWPSLRSCGGKAAPVVSPKSPAQVLQCGALVCVPLLCRLAIGAASKLVS